MRAFLTGSRVYGSPKEDSDLDLVIHVSSGDLELLKLMSDEVVNRLDQKIEGVSDGGPDSASLMLMTLEQEPHWL